MKTLRSIRDFDWHAAWTATKILCACIGVIAMFSFLANARTWMLAGSLLVLCTMWLLTFKILIGFKSRRVHDASAIGGSPIAEARLRVSRENISPKSRRISRSKIATPAPDALPAISSAESTGKIEKETQRDVVLALKNLGYETRGAKQAVKEARYRGTPCNFELLVHDSLKLLAGETMYKAEHGIGVRA